MASKMSSLVALAKAWKIQVAQLHEEVIKCVGGNTKDGKKRKVTEASKKLATKFKGIHLGSANEEFIGLKFSKDFGQDRRLVRDRGISTGTVTKILEREDRTDDQDVVLFQVRV